MASDYIIEDVRATTWTMRLRDPVTGKTVVVPIERGARFSSPVAPAHDAIEPEVAAADKPPPTPRASPAASDPPPEKTAGANEDDKKSGDRPRRRRKTGPRAGKKTESPGAPASESAGPLKTAEGRVHPVDASTLTVDDRTAMKKLGSMLRTMSRKGKRGELGWQETTEAGRSGLFARWGKGQFKILHAGNDTYALFYEWDGGKWERIACGAAEDLMKLAGAKAEDDLPGPPLTNINLEFARLLCGTPEQREGARVRLEPVFQEVDAPERRARQAAPEEPAITPPPEPPAEHDTPADDTSAMDKELMSSFNSELESVLAEEDD
jgi:hypothetical protein